MRKVLIIEDDADVYEFLDPLLSEKGFKVLVSTNGKDGVQKIKEFLPDLIILDLMMPAIDGFGVLSLLSGFDMSPKPKVIVLSAVDKMGGVEEAMHKGASAYLTKPVETKRLLQKIQEVLA